MYIHIRFFSDKSDIAAVGAAAFHSMVLFDGDGEAVERPYGRCKRVEIFGSLNRSLGEELCDAVCLDSFNGLVSGKE